MTNSMAFETNKCLNAERAKRIPNVRFTIKSIIKGKVEELGKMMIQTLADSKLFEVLYVSEDATEKEMSGVYCCDLLSIAMTKVPAGAAWVTVMSNLNTLAVASLTEAACVILAEDVAVEEAVLERAKQQGICLFRTKQPVFEAALAVYTLCKESVYSI